MKFKGEGKKFLKSWLLSSYAAVFCQKTFFSIVKLILREKDVFYLFYYNVIFKDRILFKYTRSSIEVDVIVDKKYMSF